MNAGQGSISLAPKISAKSFPAGAADNGLSVDPISGHIVLGADWGDPAGDLLSNREISLANNIFRMTTQFSQEILSLNGATGEMLIGDYIGHGNGFATSQFGEVQIFAGNGSVFYADGNQASLRTNNSAKLVVSNVGIDIGDPSVFQPQISINTAGNDIRIYDGNSAIWGFQMDFPTLEYNFGSITGGNGSYISVKDLAFIKEIVLTADNGIRTSDPGGGILSGAWKLGSRKAAAVVFDATQYLEVKVNGANYKLAIVN